jgi:hypothetical protein
MANKVRLATKAEYQAAVAEGREERRRGLHALSARFDRSSRRIILELTNGHLFGIPVARLRDLRGVSDAELAKVELWGGGTMLYWEDLEIAHGVPELILDTFKPRHLAQHFGRAGGRVSSRAKARAARKNGALGGRPRTRS